MKKKIMFLAAFAAFAIFAITLSPQSALAEQAVAQQSGSIYMNCPAGYGGWVDGVMGQGSMFITWVFTDEDRYTGGSCVNNPNCPFYSASGKANTGQVLIGPDITTDNWYQVDGWACYDPPAKAVGREKAVFRVHP